MGCRRAIPDQLVWGCKYIPSALLRDMVTQAPISGSCLLDKGGCHPFPLQNAKGTSGGGSWRLSMGRFFTLYPGAKGLKAPAEKSPHLDVWTKESIYTLCVSILVCSFRHGSLVESL